MIALIEEGVYAERVDKQKRALGVIGVNIERLMAKAAITNKAQLARDVGLTPSAFGDLERGRYQRVNIMLLVGIAKALNCSVDDLIRGQDSAYDEITKDRSTVIDHIADSQTEKKSAGKGQVAGPTIADRHGRDAPRDQPAASPRSSDTPRPSAALPTTERPEPLNPFLRSLLKRIAVALEETVGHADEAAALGYVAGSSARKTVSRQGRRGKSARHAQG